MIIPGLVKQQSDATGRPQCVGDLRIHDPRDNHPVTLPDVPCLVAIMPLQHAASTETEQNGGPWRINEKGNAYLTFTFPKASFMDTDGRQGHWTVGAINVAAAFGRAVTKHVFHAAGIEFGKDYGNGNGASA